MPNESSDDLEVVLEPWEFFTQDHAIREWLQKNPQVGDLGHGENRKFYWVERIPGNYPMTHYIEPLTNMSWHPDSSE